ncbi:MAG: MerR family transcriptional regulator [Oscillospiraceae bacterium]|nr:MerR family transcriptional regulator [Oscillospiraceae bacterium]
MSDNSTYTIGQVSKMWGLPISTLRYYDKEGLFPNLERKSGIRKFTETEIETLRVIDCLKKSGLEIKDIRLFMDLCARGSETFAERKELFENQKRAVEAEISRLQSTLDMLNYKCWYYESAMAIGEEATKAMKPEDMPEDVMMAFERTHESK